MDIVPDLLAALVNLCTVLEEHVQCAIGIGVLVAVGRDGYLVAGLQGLVEGNQHVVGLDIGLVLVDANGVIA